MIKEKEDRFIAKVQNTKNYKKDFQKFYLLIKDSSGLKQTIEKRGFTTKTLSTRRKMLRI